MAHIISFRTRRFDVTTETPNPTNPIAGQSVLRWLRAELATSNTPLPMLIQWAYQLDEGRLIGVPAGFNALRFDVVAKAPEQEPVAGDAVDDASVVGRAFQAARPS